MTINSSTWNDTKIQQPILSTGTSIIYSWIQDSIIYIPFIPKHSIICDLYVEVNEPEFPFSDSMMSFADEFMAWEIASDEALEAFESGI
jgi:hypothetical protein